MNQSQLFVKSILLIVPAFMFSGCMTAALFNKSEVRTTSKQQIALEDKVIAIGRPKQPITNHPSALILAGQKNSYLVEPHPHSSDPKDLFEQIYNKIDLNYIYLDPNNTISQNIKKNVQTPAENTIKYNLGRDPSFDTLVRSNLGIYYLKKNDQVSKSEKEQLLNFKFDCSQIDHQNTPYYFCQRSISTTVQVATQVKNIDNIQHKLKQPLNIQFVYEKTKKDYSKVPLRALTPVTIAADIVTSPIQGAAFILWIFAYAGAGI